MQNRQSHYVERPIPCPANGTDELLWESVFGKLKKNTPRDTLEYSNAFQTESRTLIVQMRYFLFNGTVAVERSKALERFSSTIGHSIRLFKNLYFLNLSESEFDAVADGLKTQLKTENIVIDSLPLASIKKLLALLPTSIRKMGLANISPEGVEATQQYIQAKHLPITLIYSDKLRQLIDQNTPVVIPTHDQPEINTSHSEPHTSPTKPSASTLLASLFQQTNASTPSSTIATTKRSQSEWRLSDSLDIPPNKRAHSDPECSTPIKLNETSLISDTTIDDYDKTHFLLSPYGEALSPINYGFFHTLPSPLELPTQSLFSENNDDFEFRL